MSTSMSRSRKIAWLILAAGIVAVGTVQGLRFLTRDMIDFSVVYRVGERLLRGDPIYDFSDGIMLFKYAPIIGYVLTPFALLPKLPSAFVFFLLSVLSFGLCFRMAYGWVLPQGAQGARPFWILALTFVSVLRVIMNSLDFGQVQVFILLGMLYAAGAFAHVRNARGGLVLSLLTLSKMVPAVLCVPWLLRKNWLPLAATVGFCAALLALPTLWLGPEGAWDLTAQWLNTLRVSTNQSMIERWTNQSLLSALARILADNHYHVNWLHWDMRWVILLTNGILALWLLGIVWLGARRDESSFPSIAFARAVDLSHYLLLIILAFPLAWRYHFTSLILPNMLILTYLLYYGRRDGVVWALFAVAFFLNSVVNQEILGSRLFEWFHLRSCMTLSVGLTLLALLRIERFVSKVTRKTMG